VAGKKSVMTIQKRLKIYAVSVLLITALSVIRLHTLQVVRKARRSSEKRILLAGQQ